MIAPSWRPASGYRTKSGVEMWRVWNDAVEPSNAQLEDARGRPRLFGTFEAARRVADDLNIGAGPGVTDVERRLLRGAWIMKTSSDEAPLGCFYTFADTGRTARADIVERLIAAGNLKPAGDGLFPQDSQTWTYAA